MDVSEDACSRVQGMQVQGVHACCAKATRAAEPQSQQACVLTGSQSKHIVLQSPWQIAADHMGTVQP